MQLRSNIPSRNFHHDEGVALVLTNVVNRCRCWGDLMRKRPWRFTPESLHCLRIFCQFVGQKLESYKAVKPGILRLVNHTHPTAAQLFGDTVMRDGKTDHLSRILRLGKGPVNEARN